MSGTAFRILADGHACIRRLASSIWLVCSLYVMYDQKAGLAGMHGRHTDHSISLYICARQALFVVCLLMNGCSLQIVRSSNAAVHPCHAPSSLDNI